MLVGNQPDSPGHEDERIAVRISHLLLRDNWVADRMSPQGREDNQTVALVRHLLLANNQIADLLPLHVQLCSWTADQIAAHRLQDNLVAARPRRRTEYCALRNRTGARASSQSALRRCRGNRRQRVRQPYRLSPWRSGP